MIETPRIAAIDAHPAALWPVTCTREAIQQAMGQGVRGLMDALAAQGASPAGPLFTHHLRRPTDTFEFHLGVPLDQPVGASADGRMQPGEWPAMRVARTEYRGRYEGLPGAWEAFHAWIAAQGLRPSDDAWECYLTGPETGSDPSAWRTELIQPLRD
ncbi:GyrI-like domain-containing protein [Paracidovorax anthurii]|uniref:Effector-binding domain-containing protein n=1 Tax=Paracidovorax anthurii TaxID=78229 RepID=A0A328YPH4_9BURK|nr:GyrI-like domain-containing protein [Paracidovorax anthurii]RAR75978.1 effector-binding domain-containing protein [Paracidovorax anthurii]WCM92960.1 GyrI-like domain-containing protein [Acidovorax sp. NCPPB 2350]